MEDIDQIFKNKSLEELEAELVDSEAQISAQEAEIKITESHILLFKDCLSKQNEALKSYIVDRYNLKAEKKKFKNSNLIQDGASADTTSAYSYVEKHEMLLKTQLQDAGSTSEFSVAHSEETEANKTSNDINESASASQVTSVQDDTSNLSFYDPIKEKREKDLEMSLQDESVASEFSTAHSEATHMSAKGVNESKKSLKRKHVNDIKSELLLKKIKVKKEVNLGKNSKADQTSSPCLIPRRKWNDTSHINKQINQIIGFQHNVYLCGSNGMLHIITGKETVIVNTGTNEDILQMSLFTYTNTLSLATFTKNHLILFIDVLKCQIPEALNVSVQGNIHATKEVIYMPLKDGKIKKFRKEECKVESYIEHSHGKVLFFVPCYGVNKKRALITLEDRKLYKTFENDLDILEIIEGIKNVRSLFRIGKAKYLCSSKRKIWILNSEPRIIESLKLDENIKYIKNCKNSFAIITQSNVLLIYTVREEENIKKVHEQKFHDNVVGLSTENSKIHLMISNEIVTLKILA